MRRTRSYYSREFIAEVLAYWAAHPTLSCAQVARDKGVSLVRNLYNWRKLALSQQETAQTYDRVHRLDVAPEVSPLDEDPTFERLNSVREYEQFVTRDLPLAAALAISFPLTRCTRQSDRRLEFCFEATPELEEARDSYWHGTMLVEPRSYNDQIKKFKDRYFEKY